MVLLRISVLFITASLIAFSCTLHAKVLGSEGPNSQVYLGGRNEGVIQIHSFSDDGTRGSNDEDKKSFVRNMMKHAFDGYKKYAWGCDQLKPVSKMCDNWYGKYSILSTPVDMLDTLLLMGMTAEYEETKELVLSRLRFDQNIYIQVFETNIRILGGLLSAYELDGDPRLLAKAKEMGDALSLAFNTTSGIPFGRINLSSKLMAGFSDPVCLAEAGTLQLEMQYLSDVTGDRSYGELALFALEQMHYLMLKDAHARRVHKGLYAKMYATETLESQDKYSHGISGTYDSFYEYLLKLWLSTSVDRFKDMFVESAKAIIDNLIIYSPDKQAAFAPNAHIIPGSEHARQEEFHHLSCFAGGMYVLGAQYLANNHTKEFNTIGEKLTYACWKGFELSPTGLAGESVHIGDGDIVEPNDNAYLQRPETIESIFYMWRKTHDPKYREWGWKMAQSIHEHTWTEGGYSALAYAFQPETKWRKDVQDSFFLAETLKYLYLLFCDDDVVPLEEFVFNTEAHPISRRGFGKRANPADWVRIPEPEEEWYGGRKVGSIRDPSTKM